jgi:hypothetical protein
MQNKRTESMQISAKERKNELDAYLDGKHVFKTKSIHQSADNLSTKDKFVEPELNYSKTH